jgi:SAM-dependent methyltransferase
MNLKNFSTFQYKLFCKAEGSQHIVSEFALYHILKLIEKYSVKSVLEVGLGIGTISGSILKYAEKFGKNIYCVGTEKNNFCLEKIPINLGIYYNKLNIFSEVSQIDSSTKFDLIVVDGAEDNLELVKDMLTNNGIIVIEGDRSGQEKTIKNIFPRAKFVHLISLKRNGDYSVKRTKDYQGGLKVLFINPDTNQKRHWAELKLKSALKTRIRKNFA